MKKTILTLTLIVSLAILASCNQGVAWETSESSHRIDGTIMYNDVNYYDGVSLGMSYDDYLNFASERYGSESLYFYESLSYDGTEVVDGVVWKAIHVRLYDETKDLNGFFTAAFKNDVLNWTEAGMLFGCEDFDDFNDKSDELINVNKAIYDGMKSYSHPVPSWEFRVYESEDGSVYTHIDLVSPDAIYPAEDNGMATYVVSPYEEGKAGVVLFNHRYLLGDDEYADGLWDFADADFLTFVEYD